MARVIKSTPSVSSWMYLAAFVGVVLLLFFLLTMSHKNQRVPKQETTTKPIVIMVDKTSSGVGQSDAPIYPKTLPKYSNSQAPLDYQQVGILTSNETDKEPVVLPLFGRKVYGRSDRWQYYTATDKNNMMRIPLHIGSRDCEDTNGCNELSTGDKLSVDIYQGREFTATIYRTEAPRYFASSY